MKNLLHIFRHFKPTILTKRLVFEEKNEKENLQPLPQGEEKIESKRRTSSKEIKNLKNASVTEAHKIIAGAKETLNALRLNEKEQSPTEEFKVKVDEIIDNILSKSKPTLTQFEQEIIAQLSNIKLKKLPDTIDYKKEVQLKNEKRRIVMRKKSKWDLAPEITFEKIR